MATIAAKIKENYDYIFYELADERSRDMFPSGFAIISLLLFYLYFTLSLGPRLMRDVKPFKLRSILFYYNLLQIFLCIYSLYYGLRGGWLTSYNYACQPVDYTDNSETRMMLFAVWLYVQIKLFDLLDTVFFVLRKKDRQISFLHVCHHFLMPVAAFGCLKYYPNGHGTLVGIINTMVHVVMYGYYFIAGLGPKFQKYLWWKKYLTTAQIIQFVINFIHHLVPLFDSSCGYPKFISYILCVGNACFIYMFSKFYYLTYIKTSPKATNRNYVKLKSK